MTVYELLGTEGNTDNSLERAVVDYMDKTGVEGSNRFIHYHYDLEDLQYVLSIGINGRNVTARDVALELDEFLSTLVDPMISLLLSVQKK